MVLPDTRVITYHIDGLNRRVGKSINGVRQWGLLYANQLEPVAELDADGNVVASFIYADRPHVPSLMLKGGQTYRILADHLGSVRLVVNIATGAIAQRMTYDEYGNVVEDTNPGFQPFGYAGGIYDRDTGLVRFGARDYDAVAGRWTAKDPIGFRGSSNFFDYSGSDPVNFFDLNGLQADRNAFREGDPGREAAGKYKSSNYVWAGHGNTLFVEDQTVTPARAIYVDELADLIRNDPGWRGRDAELLTCHGGKSPRDGEDSLAQQLSDRLGVSVFSGPNYQWWYSDSGNTINAPRIADPDGWRGYSPDLNSIHALIEFKP